MAAIAAAAIAAAMVMQGCGGSGPILPAAPPRSERVSVVFLGDSLTAGYGVEPGQSFPAVVQGYWASHGLPWSAINEGVSGDTTADVRNRLAHSQGPGAELTILEIGANDAFQAVPIQQIEANLRQIIRALKAGGSRVALCTMYFGTGFLTAGDAYTREFNALYSAVGRAENVPVLPPLLRGIFARAELWLPDRLHPTADGHTVVARDLLLDLNPGWKL